MTRHRNQITMALAIAQAAEFFVSLEGFQESPLFFSTVAQEA
jgi:hypothetical protein